MTETMRIGHLRMAYLDSATGSLATQDFDSCMAQIESFMIWVQEKTNAEKLLTEKWKEIEARADRKIQEKIKAYEAQHLQKIQMDELIGNEGVKIGVESIKQKLNACVQISLKEGLFSE